jgi:hypothetical protein
MLATISLVQMAKCALISHSHPLTKIPLVGFVQRVPPAPTPRTLQAVVMESRILFVHHGRLARLDRNMHPLLELRHLIESALTVRLALLGNINRRHVLDPKIAHVLFGVRLATVPSMSFNLPAQRMIVFALIARFVQTEPSWCQRARQAAMPFAVIGVSVPPDRNIKWLPGP